MVSLGGDLGNVGCPLFVERDSRVRKVICHIFTHFLCVPEVLSFDLEIFKKGTRSLTRIYMANFQKELKLLTIAQ